MDAKWRQNTIQTRLKVLLAVVLLPILALEGWSYYNSYRERYDTELRANLELAHSMGNGFNAFVQGVLHTELAIGISAASSPPLSSSDFNRLLERCADNALGVEIFSWIGADGRILASSFSEAVGVNVSDRPYYAAILSGREWAVGNLVLSKTTGKPVFTINRAIRDSDGSLLGIVTAGVFSDGLKDVLPLDRLGDAGVSLLDGKGVLVYRYPDLDYTWEERNWLPYSPAA